MATDTIKEFLVRLGFRVDEDGLKKFNNEVSVFHSLRQRCISRNEVERGLFRFLGKRSFR